MKRTIHNFVQGSPEWHAYRATPNQFNASDAPAMLGESLYKSRDQLLKDLATGVSQEVNAMTQRKFDDGHRFEEEDRPRAEEYIGQELFPATVSVDLGSMKLSSSLDGWTMCEAIIYEHKTKNKLILEFAARNEIPLLYRIQMEQQLLCSGADRCLFSASNGAADNEPVRIWYFPDLELRARLIAGWKQLAIELASYILPESEAPAAVAELMPSLPTISYSTQFTGTTLALRSNLDDFKIGVAKLAELSKVKLETDQDFANAIARIKICEDAEARIALVKSMAIGEVVSIDTFAKELDALDKVLSQIRLGDKKQVDKRKEEIKAEVITAAQAQWAEHLNSLNKQLSGATLPHVTINLTAAIKGLKTVASLKSKANDELARAKIEANQLFDKVDANLKMINEIAAEYLFLFADLQQICGNDKEHLRAVALQRIADHKQAEKVKAEEHEKKRMEDEEALLLEQKSQAEAQPAFRSFGGGSYSSSVDFRTDEAPLADYEQYAQMSDEPQASTPITTSTPMYVPTKEMQEEFEESFVDLNDFQKGRIAGLELALKLFEREGSMGFVQAVKDFIEVGAHQPASKAA